MTLEIVRIIGPNCLTLDDGRIVYDQIYSELKSGNVVDLDFNGVKLFASPFFNGSIGLLYKDFSSDVLNRLIRVLNISSNGSMVMRKVIENAKSYYLSPLRQVAIDRTVKAKSEGE